MNTDTIPTKGYSTAYDRAISTVTQSLTRVAQASQKEAQ